MSTSAVATTVNDLIGRLHAKAQDVCRTQCGAHLPLQPRCASSYDTLFTVFRRWHWQAGGD